MCIKLSYKEVLTKLPKRRVDAHKGDAGKVLLLCGSLGFTGAAALAAMGALRCGSGLVYLGVPRAIYEIEAIKLNEAIVFPLDDEDGMISKDAIETIMKYLPKMDAVLIGPGLGVSPGTEYVVNFVLQTFSGPVVIDADGITMMMNHKNILRDRTGQTVITPHEGEYSRFVGSPVDDRQVCAQKLAKELGCIVVLKGHNTVVTDGAAVYVNPTGNSGMAVGGSGDVLAGMIVSLIGQGMTPIDATACAVWLHGAAGDVCAKKIGRYGMLPTDMLRVLPRLMK